MKILLAVDGSEFTTAALGMLARIPFPQGSELILLAVAPEIRLTDDGGVEEEVRSVRASLEADARRALDDAGDRAAAIGLSVTRVVRTGYVANEIVDCAVELDADLIVVGSHGRRGIKRFLLGSVSHKVVTYAPCSVLLVRAPTTTAEPTGALRVLVAIDDSKPARAALSQLASLATRAWCEVRVVTVSELITMYRMEIRQRMTDSWKQMKAADRLLVQNAGQMLTPIATTVATEVIEAGSVSEAIVDKATETATELIVVGATGRGRMERALLGSVSDRVVRHAGCSVWVARG